LSNYTETAGNDHIDIMAEKSYFTRGYYVWKKNW